MDDEHPPLDLDDAAVAPAPAPGLGRRLRRRRQLRQLRWVLAAAAGLAAAITSGAAPTGVALWDPVLTGLAVAVVAYACGTARRWSWLVLAGVGAGLADGWGWAALGVVALILAVAATVADFRSPIVGTTVGALATQPLLHLTDLDQFALSTVAGLVATACVLGSAYRQAHRHTRRRARQAAIGFVAFATVAGLGLAVALVDGRLAAERGLDLSRDGLDSLRAGDQEEAVSTLQEAELAFSASNDALSSPFTWPARLVPVLAQQATAVADLAAAGTNVTGVAAATADAADYQGLRLTGGRIDLDAVASMEEPLLQAEAAQEQALVAVDEAVGPWVLPPLADRADDLSGDLERTIPETRLALESVRVVPELLGAEGTRRYLVLFTNPSESRFLGGFVGSYAELVATDGQVELVRSGPITELSEAEGSDDRTLVGLEEYQRRYGGRLRPARFIQNVTASPFLDDVAEAARQLYPQAGGSPVDGVVVVDPTGLAALLRLSGPVQVPGLDQPLTAQNVEQLLLRDQYSLFEGDEQAQEQLFADASEATLEALLARELPGPAALGDALGPAVGGGHLQLEVFEDPDARELLGRLGARGILRTGEGGDLLAVRTTNASGSKIDAFLERSAEAEVTIDPETGRIRTVLDLRLENRAPSEGLPQEVIGNVVGDPVGTSRVYVSVFTPLTLERLDLAGAPAPVEVGRERDLRVYSTQVLIPPGGGRELRLTLDGVLADPDRYTLRLVPQPLVIPERWGVAVTGADDAAVVEAQGATVEDGRALWEGALVESRAIEAVLDGR